MEMHDAAHAGRTRLLAWSGPDPRRVDAAHVWLGSDRLTAHGSSTTADHTVTYRLRTTEGWVTSALDVTVEGDGWRRMLALRRATDGWSALVRERGADGDERVRPLELPDLGGALDCDLALCPLTNTMPVLREGLVAAAQRGERRRRDLLMAWVSLPDLQVLASQQVYEAGPPVVVGGGAHVRYAAGEFEAHLEVDADGLIVNYPGLGRRLAL